MRIRLTVAYDGSAFSGLQIQKRTPHTVIGVMQRVLSQLGIDTPLIASGRTDTGVHASAQVMHLDLPPHWQDLSKLQTALNYQLPSSIYVKSVHLASATFHARYDAIRRTYRYLLCDGAPNPFEANYVTHTDIPLDLAILNQGMKALVGTHDFAGFQKSGSTVSHTVRTMFQAFAYRHHGKVVLTFQANGYLRSQIRLMVGMLLALNAGKITLDELIEQRDGIRRYHTRLAPPNGLYLAKVSYPLTVSKAASHYHLNTQTRSALE